MTSDPESTSQLDGDDLPPEEPRKSASELLASILDPRARPGNTAARVRTAQAALRYAHLEPRLRHMQRQLGWEPCTRLWQVLGYTSLDEYWREDCGLNSYEIAALHDDPKLLDILHGGTNR